jgi:UPF0755 protein
VLKKVLIGLIFLSIAVGAAWISYLLKEVQKPMRFSDAETSYVVERGASLKRVLNDFAVRGWITMPRVHEVWLRYNDLTKLQRGEYILTSDMSSTDAVKKIIAGEKLLRSIQFIEGKTFADNLQVLNRNSFVLHTIGDASHEEIMAQISSDIQHPEGWFFPDTYFFETGTTDIEILKLAYQRTQKVLAEEWGKKSAEAEVSTPYEALILASIIEKETGAAFERPMISGVFTRRLKQGMRLQTDPTVIYGLGPDFNGNLTRSHLRADTPYNTYTRKGLPPTPIANAGREAIAAALNPADGNTLFFVAKGDGTHHFSATLDEHNQAVRQYQRFGRRSDYQSAPTTATSGDESQ